mmetsp:Transcript_179/g.671  ORF Transcript_179/g.671 Transcript_179/m.671 type:complete len:184 (+) Transcript_179:65-616(+)
MRPLGLLVLQRTEARRRNPPRTFVSHPRHTTMPMAKRRTEKGVKPGFSLMDWMRLGSHAKDLAQRKGAPLRAMSMAEVFEHRSEHDCWTVLNGKVYNLTPYLHYHPGGIPMLMSVAGKDCTTLFNKYHRWVNGSTMLQKCELGWVDANVDTTINEDVVQVEDAVNALSVEEDHHHGGTTTTSS